jgi:hypothetical protein
MFELFQMSEENPMEPTGFHYEDCAVACKNAWEFADQCKEARTYLVRHNSQTIYKAWWDGDVEHVIQTATHGTPARLYLDRQKISLKGKQNGQ